MSESPAPANEDFMPVGIIKCPNCGLSSLSWNIICARCDTDLMPDLADDGSRHKQENSA